MEVVLYKYINNGEERPLSIYCSKVERMSPYILKVRRMGGFFIYIIIREKEAYLHIVRGREAPTYILQ
jgi:hypothetical protein